MPSCNTIRGMKLEQEQEFLGTELRPSGGDRTRPSLARLSPLHCPLRLPTTAGQADCIEMSEPPSRPPELQPLNMLSRANLFPCFLMELQRSSTGCVLEAALCLLNIRVSDRLGGSFKSLRGRQHKADFSLKGFLLRIV